MGFLDKAKDLAGEHADKVEGLSDQGLDKAGEFAESKGVGADQVGQGRDFIDERVGDNGETTEASADASAETPEQP